ncbi:MAG: choice-of-anchor D domain-containing protein, partial [Candidatus Angelobacter sp.]
MNNTISSNQEATRGGGGIAVWNGNALIQGNTIENNSTGGNGGGIFVAFSSVDIVGNLVAGNSAALGGGIYESVDFFGQSPLIINNTVANNSSTSPGTALFVDGADTNVTVMNNLLVDSSGLPAVACGAGNGQVPEFVSNDVVSLVPNTPPYGGSCSDSTSVIRSISQDPRFVNAAAGNYHLQPASPAIDAGLIADNEPDQDLDGNGRIGPGNAQSCLRAIDIGAYESQIAGSGTPFLPSTFDVGTAPVSGSSLAGLSVPVSGCMQLSSLKTTGDFEQTNPCVGTLPQSLGCTIQLTFTPTAAGPRTGSLIFDFGISGPPQTVLLTGTGFLAGQATSPASLSFTAQAVGTSSPRLSLTLLPSLFGNNFASGQVNGIWISGDFSQTNTCTGPGSVGVPSSGCTFSITFTPTATGPRTGTLVVSTNQGLATVPLSGNGLSPVSATLTPSSLVFPPQLVNTASPAQAVTLTNTGSTSFTPGTAVGGGDITVDTSHCQAPLDPGASCTYSINFVPAATGTRKGLFEVQINTLLLSVDVSGTGIAPLPSASPELVAFGSQIVNTISAPQAVSLANLGTANLNLS